MTEQPGLLGPLAVPRLTTAGLAPTLWRRQAVVVAVNTGPPPTLTLTMDGVTAGPARFLRSYHPVVGDSVWCLKEGTDVLVLGALAANAEEGPTNRVGTTAVTGSSSAITGTETGITSVAAPVIEGRIYKVTFTFGYTVTVITDTFFARIREDTTAGTLRQGKRFDAKTTGSNYGFVIEAEYTADVTETKTFHATLQRLTGTGTVTQVASANEPTYLYVDYVRE